MISRGDIFGRFRGAIQRVQELGDPAVQVAFSGIVSHGLNNADGEAVFSPIKLEYLFAGRFALLLFPMEEFFDTWVFNHGHALVIVEEPLDHVRNRVVVDRAVLVARQGRPFFRSRRSRGRICRVLIHFSISRSKAARASPTRSPRRFSMMVGE